MQRGTVKADRHAAPTEHEAGPHQHRIADLLYGSEYFGLRTGRAPFGLRNIQIAQKAVERFPIFRHIDRVNGRTPDRRPCVVKLLRDIERRLPAKLDQYAVWLFRVDHVHDMLEGQRLEIQAIRRVVIGADGFRVAVDHDGFIAHLMKRETGVDTTVIELNALPDPRLRRRARRYCTGRA